MKKIYLVATVLALITALAVYMFANQLRELASNKNLQTKLVAVAINTIEENTALTEEMFTYKSIPVDAIAPNAIIEGEQTVGFIANSRIYAGEQITKKRIGKLGDQNSESLAFKLKSGERAFTLSVDEVTGVAGYLRNGDTVDIIITKTENGVTKTSVLLEKVKILRVGSNSSETDNPKSYGSVILALSEEDSLNLSQATLSGFIRLSLRPAGE